MAQFMNATQALGEIERILTNARNTIVMISPFIKINDDLIKRLMDAGKRNVSVGYFLMRTCHHILVPVAEHTEEHATVAHEDNNIPNGTPAVSRDQIKHWFQK